MLNDGTLILFYFGKLLTMCGIILPCLQIRILICKCQIISTRVTNMKFGIDEKSGIFHKVPLLLHKSVHFETLNILNSPK